MGDLTLAPHVFTVVCARFLVLLGFEMNTLLKRGLSLLFLRVGNLYGPSRRRCLSSVFLMPATLLMMLPVATYGGGDLELWSPIYYASDQDAVTNSPLLFNATTVEVRSNRNNEKEFFIANDKPWAILVKIYDQKGRLISESIAVPRTRTYLGDIFELLTNPVGKDYTRYLDGTLLSALVSTGVTESNAPPAGSINFIINSPKARAATAIVAVGSLINIAADTGDLVTPPGILIKDFADAIATRFIWEAVTDSEFLAAVTGVILSLPTDCTYAEGKHAMTEIAQLYGAWTERKFSEVLTGYLYSVNWDPSSLTEAARASIKKSFAALKVIEIGEQSGNILAAISSIAAQSRKTERTYGIQLYRSQNEYKQPNITRDLSLDSALGKRYYYLAVMGVTYLDDMITPEGNLDPEVPIKASDFIALVDSVNNAILKRMLPERLLDGWAPLPIPTKLDALNAMYLIYDKLYPRSVFNSSLLAQGDKEQLTRMKRMYFKQNHFDDLWGKYTLEDARRAGIVIPAINPGDIFTPPAKLDEPLTKGDAISLIYDVAFYNGVRIGHENDLGR